MNNFIKTKDRNILKAIAYYQIIGGIIGIGLILYTIFGGIEIKISNLVILILATGLYIFSIISGIYLRQENWEKGIKLTTINQILQSIQFSILGYTFIYVSLINLYVGLDYTNELLLNFDFSLTNFLFTLTQKNE